MYPANRPRRRRAFTLIELLVVIAIIAVLMGLTSVAAMKFLGKGPETQNRIELSQFEASIAKFRAENSDLHIPSRFRLRENLNAYTSDPYEQECKQYLVKLFSRNLLNNSTVDWDSDGTIDANPIDLEGQECLVFFLGGRLERNGADVQPRGFSTGVNPMASGGATRRGPYYEFKSNRLVQLPGSPYYAYKDAHGTPIAYFSHNARPNGYSNDCGRLGVTPYYTTAAGGGNPPAYIHPDGCQIVSAGPDKQWGAERLFPPTGIGTGPAADNVSNFVKKAFRNGP